MEHRPRVLWVGPAPMASGQQVPASPGPWPNELLVDFLETACGVQDWLAAGRYDGVVVSFEAGCIDARLLDAIRTMSPGCAVVACLADDGEVGIQEALRSGAQECISRDGLSGELVLRALLRAMARQRYAAGRRKRDILDNRGKKIEALERLAGGVAHDFNNLLTSVLGFSRFAYDALPENHPVREDIREIMAAGDRATEITRELLTFARRGMLLRKPLDMNLVVTGVRPALVRMLGSEVILELVPAERAALVLGDAAAMEEMLMLLAANARDAMPNGGTFSIGIRCSKPEHAPAECPGEIQIRVRDTGCGMTPDVIDHVFEPFFSSKVDVKGTGLGLSTVYGIVEHQDGRIEVSSKEGKGTEFRITFPRIIEDRSPVVEESRERGRGIRILLVEDEMAVRKFAARVLRGAGYEVLEAADGQQGVELFQGNGGVDLIFTDVVMPRVSGPEMVMKLREEGAECGVLYATGYAQQAITRLGMEAARGPVMLKPYTQQMLLSKVREILDVGVGARGEAGG